MRVLSVLFLMIFVPQVYAQELVCGDSCADEIPTCEDLGYKKGMYCPEGYTVCPYDSSYVWCKTYSCEDAGFYSTSGAETEARINLGYVCQKTEYHGLTCFDCSECEADPKLCRYSEANKGEGELEGTQCCNGYYTGCRQTCGSKDKSATVPAGNGVLKKTETCSSCGVDEIIVTGWECDVAGGYELSADGKSCVEVPCPTEGLVSFAQKAKIESLVKDEPEAAIFVPGKIVPDGLIKAEEEVNKLISVLPIKPYGTAYLKAQEIGYTEGSVSCGNGWLSDEILFYGRTCSRCVPADCADGYTTTATCPNTVGYDIIEQGYSGNDSCKKCVEKTCRTEYSTSYQSIANCPTLDAEGWTADKAWVWTEDTENGAGELKCGKCTPKSCPADYSENISCSNGYTIEYSTDVFYGNKRCGKCVASICSEGQTDLTVDQCEYSGFGTNVVSTGELSGGKECKKCVCEPSDCNFNQDNIGQGTGKDKCCDGNYRNCDPGDLGSARDFDVNADPNMKTYTSFVACGKTYYDITSCKEGFKLSGNSCAQMTCADYELESNPNSCSDGYMAVASTEHSGCYQCVAKTCADYNSTWKLDGNCSEGYQATEHPETMLGDLLQTCYDCNACTEVDDYIKVNNINEIPDIVTDKDLVKSCDGYLYCAKNCTAGYIKSGCSCQSASCGDGYYATSTPMMAYGNKGYYTPSNVAQARLGASLYLRCQSGDKYLYKFDQCNQTLGFMSETDCYKKTNGSNGWDWNSSDGQCGTCTAKSCPGGYSSEYQDVEDCPTLNAAGWTVDKAWTFSSAKDQYAGDKVCGKCSAKNCVGEYSSNTNCDTSTQNEVVSDQYFNGTNLCKKCEEKGCTLTDEACGAGKVVSADCTCVSDCAGYTEMYDMSKVDGLVYTNSTRASLFELCYEGSGKYKFIGCYEEHDYMTEDACYAKENGRNGWTWTEADVSHGCGTCAARSCDVLSGFIAGRTSEDCGCGQAYEKSTTYAGTEVCGKCSNIVCGSDSNAKGTSFERDGVNYGPLSYWTAANLKAN